MVGKIPVERDRQVAGVLAASGTGSSLPGLRAINRRSAPVAESRCATSDPSFPVTPVTPMVVMIEPLRAR
ncbi:MAG: hypothetical protein JWN03_8662 [Nocardia sp.]|nr:hypothetical protein [Nocardia sp.]